MKLKSALFCLLSLSTLSSFGVIVKMPNACTLEEKFDQLGLSSFNKKTHVIDKLANKQLEAKVLYEIIHSALLEYLTKINFKTQHMLQAKIMARSILMSLLENYPDATNELKNAGML